MRVMGASQKTGVKGFDADTSNGRSAMPAAHPRGLNTITSDVDVPPHPRVADW